MRRELRSFENNGRKDEKSESVSDKYHWINSVASNHSKTIRTSLSKADSRSGRTYLVFLDLGFGIHKKWLYCMFWNGFLDVSRSIEPKSPIQQYKITMEVKDSTMTSKKNLIHELPKP